MEEKVLQHRQVIRKAITDLRLLPNLRNYERARQDFAWAQVGAELAGLLGGGFNIAYEAVDRHALGSRKDHVAFRWIGRNGEERPCTHAELANLTNRFANVLLTLRLQKGDRLFILAGRIPELYVAALGALKRGVVVSPLFSAFGPEPIRTRLNRRRQGLGHDWSRHAQGGDPGARRGAHPLRYRQIRPRSTPRRCLLVYRRPRLGHGDFLWHPRAALARCDQRRRSGRLRRRALVLRQAGHATVRSPLRGGSASIISQIESGGSGMPTLPIQITFRNLQHSDAIEAKIRDRELGPQATTVHVIGKHHIVD